MTVSIGAVSGVFFGQTWPIARLVSKSSAIEKCERPWEPRRLTAIKPVSDRRVGPAPMIGERCVGKALRINELNHHGHSNLAWWVMPFSPSKCQLNDDMSQVKGNLIAAFFYALGGFTFLKFVIKTAVVFGETFILPGTNVSIFPRSTHASSS